MNKPMRVILILKLLEHGKQLSVRHLAKSLKRSERTIFRDLQALKKMQLPLKESNEGYSLDVTAWQKTCSDWVSRLSKD